MQNSVFFYQICFFTQLTVHAEQEINALLHVYTTSVISLQPVAI